MPGFQYVDKTSPGKYAISMYNNVAVILLSLTGNKQICEN